MRYDAEDMEHKITVYRDNRVDKPREVGTSEVVERVREKDLYPQYPAGLAVNRALAEFGSFDPETEDYNRFEEKAARLVMERL